MITISRKSLMTKIGHFLKQGRHPANSCKKLNFHKFTRIYLKLWFLGSGSDRGQSPVEWGDFPYVRTSVHPSVHPPLEGPRASQVGFRPIQPGLRASQASEPLRPGWLALRPAWLALKPAWLALRPAWLGLRPAWLALGPSRGLIDGRTDGWMDG